MNSNKVATALVRMAKELVADIMPRSVQKDLQRLDKENDLLFPYYAAVQKGDFKKAARIGHDLDTADQEKIGGNLWYWVQIKAFGVKRILNTVASGELDDLLAEMID